MRGGHGAAACADALWRLFHALLDDLRMPLFTVLSGYVHAARPLQDLARRPGMAKGKFRRLLVPLFVVAPIYFGLQLAVPDTNSRPDPSSSAAHGLSLRALLVPQRPVPDLPGRRTARRPRHPRPGAGLVGRVRRRVRAQPDGLRPDRLRPVQHQRVLPPGAVLPARLRSAQARRPHQEHDGTLRVLVPSFAVVYALSVVVYVEDVDLSRVPDRLSACWWRSAASSC
jgi:hypothetical protein